MVSDRLVRLGSDRGQRGKKSCPVRLIHIKGANYNLKLVTDCSVKKLSAALVALIYRHRWQIETYFKWIKCSWPLWCENYFSLMLFISLTRSLAACEG